MPSKFDYIAYDTRAAGLQAEFKERFEFLDEKLNRELPKGRYSALAVTHLEIAYAMVGKAIRDDQIERNGSAPLLETKSEKSTTTAMEELEQLARKEKFTVHVNQGRRGPPYFEPIGFVLSVVGDPVFIGREVTFTAPTIEYACRQFLDARKARLNK